MLARREKESEGEGETNKVVKGIQKAKTFPSAENIDQQLEMGFSSVVKQVGSDPVRCLNML